MPEVPLGELDIAIHGSFEEAEPCWRAIEAGGSSFVFQSFDWCSTWFETIGRALRTEPILVHARHRRTGAEIFLPLGVEPKGFGVRVLGFLDGQLADHTAPLLAGPVDSIFDPGVLRAVLRTAARAARADVVDLRHLRTRVGAAPNPLVDQHLARARYGTHRLEIDGTWEAFCADRLSRSHQAGSRRRWRRLQDHGIPRVEIASSPERACTILATTLMQKAQRYQDTGRSNPLANPAYRHFYTHMTTRHQQAGLVHVSALLLDEHVLATHWGCVHDRCFIWLMPSFDAAWRQASPGRLLLDHLVEWSFREGLRAFDFTIGDEPYKASFATESDDLYRRISPCSPLGLAYFIKSRLE